MNDTDPMLEMLRERERLLEQEYIQSKADAEKLVAIVDARLSEVRELIERATQKRRGRPRKADVVAGDPVPASSLLAGGDQQ